MDYGSQSETLGNCRYVEILNMSIATHGLFWLLSSTFKIFSCSVWIFHAEIALLLDVCQLFCYLQRC